MLFKFDPERLFGDDAFSKITGDCFSYSARFIFVLCFYLAGMIPAQAEYIQHRVGPTVQYSNGGLTASWYDSAGDAFEAGKPVWEREPTASNPGSIRAINMRPKPNAILQNGIPTQFISDKQSCAPPNGCTVVSGGGIPVSSYLVCPTGFGLGRQSGTFDTADQKLVCIKEEYSPEPRSGDCRGNPIFPATGQKIEVETDYANASGLQFQRTYRSTIGYFTSPATASLIDNTLPNAILPNCYPGSFIDPYKRKHYYCFPYMTSETPSYFILTPQGRTIIFTGPPNAITAKADVNDKLARRIDEAGAIEWVAKRADQSTEIYNAQGQLIRKTALGGRSDIAYAYSDGATPADIASRAGLLIRMSDQFGRQLRSPTMPPIAWSI